MRSVFAAGKRHLFISIFEKFSTQLILSSPFLDIDNLVRNLSRRQHRQASDIVIVPCGEVSHIGGHVFMPYCVLH
jgi:hypothetical protein